MPLGDWSFLSSYSNSFLFSSPHIFPTSDSVSSPSPLFLLSRIPGEIEAVNSLKRSLDRWEDLGLGFGGAMGLGVNGVVDSSGVAFSPQTSSASFNAATASLTSPSSVSAGGGAVIVGGALDSTPPPPHTSTGVTLEGALVDTSSSPSATPSHVTSPTCQSVTSSNMGGGGGGSGGGGGGVNITSPTAPSLVSSTAPSSAGGMMAASAAAAAAAASASKMVLRDPHVPASLLKLWYR